LTGSSWLGIETGDMLLWKR